MRVRRRRFENGSRIWSRCLLHRALWAYSTCLSHVQSHHSHAVEREHSSTARIETPFDGVSPDLFSSCSRHRVSSRVEHHKRARKVVGGLWVCLSTFSAGDTHIVLAAIGAAISLGSGGQVHRKQALSADVPRGVACHTKSRVNPSCCPPGHEEAFSCTDSTNTRPPSCVYGSTL